MKTKNIIMILAALPLLAGLTGCKSDDETTARPANETLIVEGGDITLRSNEDKKYVDITADCSWHVVEFGENENQSHSGDFGDALTVEPMRGNGNGTLTIIIDKNAGTLKRGNAYIILQSDGGLRQRISITQTSSDPGMGIGGTTDGALNFGTAGGTKTLTIESNTSWTVEQTPGTEGWLNLSKASGTGNDAVYVTAAPQPTDEDRSATLTFKYANGSKTANVIVNQGARSDISLSVDQIELKFPAASLRYHDYDQESQNWWKDGESQLVNVTANASWKVYIPTSSAYWVHVEPLEGVGNGSFRVWASPWETDTTKVMRMSMLMVVAGSQNPKQSDILIYQPVDNPGKEPVGPVDPIAPSKTPEVGQLTSMYVDDTSAGFRFAFTCYEPVAEYGVVYSETQTTPTIENSKVLKAGENRGSATVLPEIMDLRATTTYYVRAYVKSKPDNAGNAEVVYSPNMVTIKTSDGKTIPGETDNPDPQMARRR